MIKLEKYGDKVLLNTIRGAYQASKDRTPLNNMMGATIASSIIKNFEVGGRPDKWEPLKSGGESHLTGMPSYLKKTIDYVVKGDSIKIGTMSGIKYAAIHQFGSKDLPGGVIKPKKASILHWVDPTSGQNIFAKSVRIPARPYVVIQDDDVEVLEEEGLKWGISLFK